jgi:hypothetical protein
MRDENKTGSGINIQNPQFTVCTCVLDPQVFLESVSGNFVDKKLQYIFYSP